MKKEIKQKLIYARYILPPVLILILAVFTFIPAYRYTEADASREAISYSKLFFNSWTQGRSLLFDGTQISLSHTAFAKTLLTFTIISAAFYLIALGVSVWACAVAIKLFNSDDEERAERVRTFFITFVPNRIVLTALQATAIPFALFPYIMPLIYSSTLGVKVKVALVAPDALIFAIVFIVAIGIISAITASYERRFDADVFKKHQSFSSLANTSQDDDEYESQFSTEEDEAYSRLRDEQAERIRRMLSKNDGDKND